jgi:hypothetical protein
MLAELWTGTVSCDSARAKVSSSSGPVPAAMRTVST